MDDTLLSILPSLLFIIPQIIIVVACIINLKKKSASGILVLIGAGIGLLTTLFYNLAIPILFQVFNTNIYSDNTIIFSLITGISFIGSMLFAIGLLLLIQEKVKLQQSL
ncbi:hypothetical protein [Labilibaculum euxinus]